MREKIKPKDFSESFPPARLFLDDIDEIIEAFKEISNTKVTLENKDAYFENTEDIKNNLKSEYITNLIINSAKPYISLHFEPSRIRFYAEEETLLSRGLLDKIRTIIRPRQLNYLNSLTYKILYAIGGALVLSSLISIVFGLEILWRNLNSRIGLLIFMAGIFLLIISYFKNKWENDMRYHKYSIIFLFREGEKISLWKRNRDQIITGMIVGLFLLVLGVLINQGLKYIP